jgi:heme exporter protein A
MAQAAIAVAALRRDYGDRPALDGVGFELAAGESLVVLGPNGAGKTTLLRVLATLLRPSGGAVRVLGCSLPSEAWKLRGRIGYLGHEPLLYRDLNGRENLQYHARLHRIELQRVEEVLEAVQMERRASDPVRLLSRGMIQRLAVARAVLHRPRLLLLDEPRANLDPAASDLIEPLIGRGSGATRVLTSHDPRAALAEADLVLALKDGRPAFVGEPGQFGEGRLAGLYA